MQHNAFTFHICSVCVNALRNNKSNVGFKSYVTAIFSVLTSRLFILLTQQERHLNNSTSGNIQVVTLSTKHTARTADIHGRERAYTCTDYIQYAAVWPYIVCVCLCVCVCAYVGGGECVRGCECLCEGGCACVCG